MRELSLQGIEEATLLGFDRGTGVMSDETHHLLLDSEPTQGAGAIQRMESSVRQLGRIAEVVEPSCRYENAVRHSQVAGYAFRTLRNCPDVSPPPREGAGEMSSSQEPGFVHVGHVGERTEIASSATLQRLGAP